MTDEQQKPTEVKNAGRGKLKVFLGAVPGVGKTFRMLAEAHRRISRGEDVVVGLIEAHGRPATAELLEGLEQIPLKAIEYRGRTFYELDTDAILKRCPQWVLIDELAHTNVPGAAHEKRWESIEELRDAGINIITTVNVQHLESLNDSVADITGVRVRETVPDWVVDSADEIELVDLTPDAVINRLKRGDIYKGESIPQALGGFFKKGNIVALRELALRQTTIDVDQQLQALVPTPAGARPVKAVRDRVVVCVSPKEVSFKLVRRGYRLARRMEGELVCLYVKTSERGPNEKQEALLGEIFDLARNLGGEVVELEGDSVGEQLIKYVNANKTTMVVMGQSAPSRWEEIVRGSLVTRLMRETKDIDIVVAADTGPE
ncbi:MAG: universal stress protein [Dehalococcoidia bacterium]|jgi:two-component system sensor histidine kinase KdpD